jgi:hypothetical protein
MRLPAVFTLVIALLPCAMGSEASAYADNSQAGPKQVRAPAIDSYAAGSVFTVESKVDIANGRERQHVVQAGTSDLEPNETSFDLAVLQFRDDGKYVDARQIDAADDCVRKARSGEKNKNGALVLVFIHGWHHGANWNRTPVTTASNPDGDEHFHSFRLVLESLALREAERYQKSGGAPAGRRVVGIYVAWNGDPEGYPLKSTPLATHLTFWNRYDVAEMIGASIQFRESIRRIVNRTKEPVTVAKDQPPGVRPESPLVMIGHSMGALMLQSAFATLLEDRQQPLIGQQQPKGVVQTLGSGNPVAFPDLILSLNSAADSAIAKRTLTALSQRSITKTAASGGVSYSPPLMMSVTSTGDVDTRDNWPKGKRGRTTDGNDPSLFTHTFALLRPLTPCNPGGAVDMGQNWHCLHRPQPPGAETPNIPIDLPTRERRGRDDVTVPHAGYMIATIGDKQHSRLMWVFQVPPEIVKDHNDIFNSRARSLLLGLIQASGAVASISENWADSFAP